MSSVIVKNKSICDQALIKKHIYSTYHYHIQPQLKLSYHAIFTLKNFKNVQPKRYIRHPDLTLHIFNTYHLQPQFKFSYHAIFTLKISKMCRQNNTLGIQTLHYIYSIHITTCSLSLNSVTMLFSL